MNPQHPSDLFARLVLINEISVANNQVNHVLKDSYLFTFVSIFCTSTCNFQVCVTMHVNGELTRHSLFLSVTL